MKMMLPAYRRPEPLFMEMHQIRYFLALSETLNFTRSAEMCNVTQPALSRAIQALEEELGGQLFRRERNQTHMTDLGRLLRPQLEAIYNNAQAARTTAQSFLKMKQADVKLGVMCTIGPMRFSGFLSSFQAANQGIRLTMLEGVPSRLSDLLMQGEIDVAIFAQPGPLHERFDAHPLYKESFVIAFPPGHRFSSMNTVAVKELDGESYLSRINCEYYDHLKECCQTRGVRMQDAFRSEREDWVQSLVLAGMGVCFIPEYSPVLPGLQQRRVADPEIQREILLVTVAGRRFSPAVMTFVKAAKAFAWRQ
jgi:LysR family hydrogen peroxide-inducible transcriptional activator